MHTRRLYIPGSIEPHTEYELSSMQMHYLRHVLRLSPDHPLRAFDDTGREYDASISLFRTKRMCIRTGESVSVPSRESPLNIWLYPALTRGVKIDWIIEKATELGVRGIRPIMSQRSPVRLPAEREQARLAHWNGIAQSATAQSGRTQIPVCTPPMPWEECLTLVNGNNTCFILCPDAVSGLDPSVPPSGTIHLLVGPEGGFTPDEIHQATQAGFIAIRLGPRTLRNETAPLVALSAFQTLWGDLAP
ncbi:MAG: 16S rRNA (uracil(1498)-N(3))-methyltransferase [Gammaproteobacteria bacterium]